MIDIKLTPVKGLTVENGLLTLKLEQSPYAEIQKTESGLFIEKQGLNSALIDSHTIISTGGSSYMDIYVDANTDVVVRIFSMCQYQVTNRTNKASYAVSNELKTIDDVVGELNAIIDAYDASGDAIPMNVPRTSYILKPKDLFQFRRHAIPSQFTNGTETWPCAIDDGNRPQGERITALFVVKSITYDDESRVSKLTLQCLWSSLTSYTKGTEYTYGS